MPPRRYTCTELPELHASIYPRRYTCIAPPHLPISPSLHLQRALTSPSPDVPTPTTRLHTSISARLQRASRALCLHTSISLHLQRPPDLQSSCLCTSMSLRLQRA